MRPTECELTNIPHLIPEMEEREAMNGKGTIPGRIHFR
jgi:hypothetical protein